jgi:hypothetical protein
VCDIGVLASLNLVISLVQLEDPIPEIKLPESNTLFQEPQAASLGINIVIPLVTNNSCLKSHFPRAGMVFLGT